MNARDFESRFPSTSLPSTPSPLPLLVTALLLPGCCTAHLKLHNITSSYRETSGPTCILVCPNLWAERGPFPASSPALRDTLLLSDSSVRLRLCYCRCRPPFAVLSTRTPTTRCPVVASTAAFRFLCHAVLRRPRRIGFDLRRSTRRWLVRIVSPLPCLHCTAAGPLLRHAAGGLTLG